MSDAFEIEAFYDGSCPLCVRQRRLLERLDGRRRIRFVDVTASGFDPASVGAPGQVLLERIHARVPGGTLVAGVEALRRLYATVGFPRLAAISRWPGLSRLLELGYGLVARNRHRLWLTGRCAGGARRAPRA